MTARFSYLALAGVLAAIERVTCQGCQQPRSFHKADKCPHLDVAGAVESWGPETYTPPSERDSP